MEIFTTNHWIENVANKVGYKIVQCLHHKWNDMLHKYSSKKYNLNNRKSIIKIIRYRSNLEACFARDLQEKKLTFDYEKTRLSFVPKIKHYTPDFYLVDYDFYIETKGLFIASDRAKHLLIKEQHPDLDIRFIFQTYK